MKTTTKIISLLKYPGLYFVSFMLIIFAVSKFMGAQFRVQNFAKYTALGDLSDMDLAWGFFERSYNYNLFIGIIEMLAAILILFKRTRLVGLLLAAGIYTNVVLMDYEFGVKDALGHALLEYLIVIILLIPYLKDLKKFFWNMGGKLTGYMTQSNKILSIYLPIAFILLSATYGFISIKEVLASEDKIIGSYHVTKFTLNDEDIDLTKGKYTREPMLFFEFANEFVLSINDDIFYGNYEKKSDSIFIKLNKRFENSDSFKAKIDKDERILDGMTNNGQPFKILIERITE